jgi:hypothetical protein
VENSHRRNVEEQCLDAAASQQVGWKATRIQPEPGYSFRKRETDGLEIEVGYPNGVVKS